jgi:cadmium resistance protein CadD (predicted permease)
VAEALAIVEGMLLYGLFFIVRHKRINRTRVTVAYRLSLILLPFVTLWLVAGVFGRAQGEVLGRLGILALLILVWFLASGVHEREQDQYTGEREHKPQADQ